MIDLKKMSELDLFRLKVLFQNEIKRIEKEINSRPPFVPTIVVQSRTDADYKEYNKKLSQHRKDVWEGINL